MFRTQPRSKVPDGVVAEIRRQVAAGLLGDGDRLPSVEALADQFGISRASVREALQALAALGVIEIRHGRGSFVRAAAGDADRYATWIREQRYALAELCELRVAVETTAARLAAAKATADDLRAMAATLERSRCHAADLADVVVFDGRFHQEVVRAARNRLLAQALDLTQNLLAEVRYRTLSLPGEVDRALAAHQRILDAIADRDPEEAARAMRDHLRTVEEDLGIQVA